MAVGNPWGIVFLFQGNDFLRPVTGPGFLKSSLIGEFTVTHGHVGVYDHIVLPEIRVQGSGILCHGCFHCNNRSIFFIFHFNQAGCPGCGHLILSDDSRNIVPVKADPLVQYFPVTDILMLLFHAPWMACRGKLAVGNIEACDNLHHTRHLIGLCQVKAFDQAVGNGRVHDLTVQDVSRFQIRGVLGLPGHLPVSINTFYLLPYNIHFLISSLLFLPILVRIFTQTEKKSWLH